MKLRKIIFFKTRIFASYPFLILIIFINFIFFSRWNHKITWDHHLKIAFPKFHAKFQTSSASHFTGNKRHFGATCSSALRNLSDADHENHQTRETWSRSELELLWKIRLLAGEKGETKMEQQWGHETHGARQKRWKWWGKIIYFFNFR